MKFKSVFYTIFICLALLFTYIPFSHWIISKNPSPSNHDEIRSAHAMLLQNYIESSKYRCCLEDACHSCLTNRQSSSAVICDCLDLVVNEKMPCPECVGGILDGDGNHYLRKYFAKSLSDGLGANHYPQLKNFILEEYGIPIEEQA